MSIEIREGRPGEASLVAHLFLSYLRKIMSFFPTVEGYILNSIAEYYDDYEDNGLWVIDDNGEVKGAISAVKKDENLAQLRLFCIHESLQSKGYGNRLLEIAMDFCRKMNYTHVILWTVDICSEARHLYSKFGFELTETKENTEWADYKMTEEKWEVELE